MRVELIQRAANVLFDVPDEMHEEIITLIDAVTKDAEPQAPNLGAAFGEWCWLLYTVEGDVIGVLDVGCARCDTLTADQAAVWPSGMGRAPLISCGETMTTTGPAVIERPGCRRPRLRSSAKRSEHSSTTTPKTRSSATASADGPQPCFVPDWSSGLMLPDRFRMRRADGCGFGGQGAS
ncbi:hypothetical protein [Streptomyces sp. NPDC001127]|uniref:hypothetical protein n=1 Tax=Streptomyces sp. NPDC001127 TaxID=3154377 RepID=UPI00332871E3